MLLLLLLYLPFQALSADQAFSKYVNAGTSIKPPPVENSPEIKPASRPIIIFLIFCFVFILIVCVIFYKKILIKTISFREKKRSQ